MTTKKIVAVLSLSILLSLSSLAQDSVPAGGDEPATASDSATAAPVAPAPPLSGVLSQSSGNQVLPAGVIVPSLTVSEVTNRSGASGSTQTSISGAVSYNHASAHGSFDLKYAGGTLFNSSGTGDSSFQELFLTRAFVVRRWTFVFGNTVSYMPQAPIGGGVGIPGLGGFTPGIPFSNVNPDVLPSQSVLSFNNRSVDNSSFGQAQYNFTRQTSVTAVASYGLLRYIDNSALDGHQTFYSTGLNHTIGRSQASVQASYSRFAQDASDAGLMEAYTAQLKYSRLLARDFSAQVSFGPELVHPHGSGGRVLESGSAAINYARKRNTASLEYAQGVNGGSGLLLGSASDTGQLSVGHQYRLWTVSANGSYADNRGVSQAGHSIARSAGIQVSHTFQRNLSTYFSYSYVAQTAGNLCTAGICAFNDSEHIIGVGFDLHPRGLRLGH